MDSKRFGAIFVLGFLSFILYHYTQNPSHSMELMVQWCFGILITAAFIIAAAINITTISFNTIISKRKNKLGMKELQDYNKKILEMRAKPQFDNFRYFMLTWQFSLAYFLSETGFDVTAILFAVVHVIALISEYKMRKSLQTL